MMAISFCKLSNSLLKLLNPRVKVSSVKFYSTIGGKLYAEKLKNKCLIYLKGKDAPDLLQGLITNDIGHLASESKAIYSMFLNNRGRIMFDAIIAKGSEEETYYIECDSDSVQILERHLKKYKLRKKVTIKCLEEELCIYTIFSLTEVLKLLPPELASTISGDIKLKRLLDNCNHDLLLDNLDFGDFIAYRDPRLHALGYRVIVPSESDISDVNNRLSDTKGLELHRLCRYWLGIAEGKDELPFEQCFPLESNCDYLHGVSFHKGCYIGQELTARSHHTGVIRKRVMPLILDSCSEEELPTDITSGESETARRLGKLRGVLDKYGVALLRTAECLKLSELYIGEYKARCFKPLWWPQEASKPSKPDVT